MNWSQTGPPIKRQFMRWFASTVLLLNLAAVYAGASHAQQQQGQQQAPVDAQTLWTQSLVPYMGTGSAVQTNMVQPMIAGSPVVSIDGLNSANSNMLASINKPPIMQIQVGSYPPSGDICSVVVAQDLTGAGPLSTSSTFPVSANCNGNGNAQMISGICANGFITCPAGTFYPGPPAQTQCQFNIWSASSTGQVTANQTMNFADLQACYCFNNSCSAVNNSAVMNLDVLTGDLAGGIINAFVAATNYAITNTESPGTGIIMLWGTKPTNANTIVTTNASAGQAYTTNSPPTAQDIVYPYADPGSLTSSFYVGGGAGLTGMGNSVLASQQAIPNSLYNIVATASAGNYSQTISCTNTRNVTFSENVCSGATTGTPFLSYGVLVGQNGGVDPFPANGFNAIINKTGPNIWHWGLNTTSANFGYNANLNTIGVDLGVVTPSGPITCPFQGQNVVTSVEVAYTIWMGLVVYRGRES